MASPSITPENFEERVIWYAITGTYAFYAMGAVYIVAPVLAWILLLRLLYRYLWPTRTDLTLSTGRPPVAVWLWVIGMLMMLIALVVGHLDFELGAAKLIKSAVGWAKGWALFAIFPLVGCLPIRPQVIYRACAIVCLHTLLLLPVFVGAYLLHLPQTLYVSPLEIVGGPGPMFFAVNLYEGDVGGGVRWWFFTPWAPATGFVANMYFIFALEERARRWKWIGITGSVVMILFSKSRMAVVAWLAVWLLARLLSRLTLPWPYFAAATGSTLAGLCGTEILRIAERFQAAFRGVRPASSRVRATLVRIAFDRWPEAPLWGHGIQEPGPHLVEYMPIGSHHTWYGLLFVKGIVGFLALAIPLLWTFVTLVIRAQSSHLAAVGLALVLLLSLYTFGENLEILAYLFWPALVIIGAALKGETPRPAPSPTVCTEAS